MTGARKRGCPEPPELVAFNAGKLAMETLEAVAEHVASCPACQSRLESLEPPLEPSLLALLGSASTPPEQPDDGLVALRDRLLGMPVGSGFFSPTTSCSGEGSGNGRKEECERPTVPDPVDRYRRVKLLGQPVRVESEAGASVERIATAQEQVGTSRADLPSCPSRRELVDYSAGKLPDDSLQAVAEHVETCDSCQSRLETVEQPVEQGLLELLQADSMAPELCEEDMRALRERLDSLTIATRPLHADGSTFSLRAKPSTAAKGLVPGTQRAPIPDSATPDSVTPASDRGALPERIGRYFVLRELGRGGFATVYLAKDPQHNRLVAIKVPRADRLDVNDQGAVEQFLREARTVAELHHPAIVQVYDCGRCDNGRCFVVMQYIDGRTLRDVMTLERTERVQLVRWMRQVAEAVQAAHGREIFHRDIKPANILIDGRGRPYLADFGLAVREAERWSHRYEIAGTFAYMSPEQIRGQAHLIDGRSDIWSLGVILYELLAGRRPFRGQSRTQLCEEICQREATPLRQIRQDHDASFDRILSRCLAKDVASRYASALDLARDLKRAEQKETLRRVSPLLAIGAVALLPLLVLAMTWLAGIDRGRSGKAVGPPVNAAGWRQVLHTPPGKLVWPSVTDSTRMLSQMPGEVTLDTSDFVLAQCGEAEMADFRFRVSLQSNAWRSLAGVFWGYHQVSADPPRFACQGIYVSYDARRQAPRFYLHRETFTIRDEGGIQFVDHQPHGPAIPIEPLGPDECQLEIQVRINRLASVRWNGLVLEELADPLPTRENFEVPECRGKFGLLNFSGATTFRDAQWKPLTGENER